LNTAEKKHIAMLFPSWLPPSLVARLGGKVRVRFQFSEAERTVLRKRKPERPSDWAERWRIVKDSSLPGRWQNIFAPYLAPLMDALRFPGVEMGIICKSPQTGATEAALNLLGHAADHAPGPAMIVYADKDTAKDINRDRILPMFEESPRLRRYLPGQVGDESHIRINLRHMPIFLGWAGSVSRLGSRPIRLMVLDEIDKYPENKKEASAEALAEKRTITWRGRRMIIKLSTPTTESGPIWQAFSEEAHAKFDWHVVCPACGKMQLMLFERIRWPEGERDPEKVLQGKLAVYRCAHCAAEWDDTMRDLAVRKGQWIERKSGLDLWTHLELHHPGKLGFHIPAWISYFVSLSEVAHAFLRQKKSGRLTDLKDFENQYCALPWTEQHAERQEDAILALCDDRPRGRVPGPVDGIPRVAALVAGIDTQASYFRYVIRAWGFGEAEESWLVQCGTAPTFAALDDLLWKSVYTDVAGNEYRVRAAVIDAMGNRTKQVYAWCAKRPRVMAYQGKQNQATPIAYSPIEFFPDDKGTKIKIPGGILLRRVDTTFFKSDLSEKITISPGDPGSFWLHANTGIKGQEPGVGAQRAVPDLPNTAVTARRDPTPGLLNEYAKEMCAEVFNPETLVWENPKSRPNHFWDCEVMSLVAAWELGLRYRRPASQETGDRKQVPGNKGQAPGARRLTAGERLAALRER